MTDYSDLIARLRGYHSFNEWGDKVHHSITDEAASALESLQGENQRLRDRLASLEFAERDYRSVHDLYGDGSKEAGRAWDLMRRSGDSARSLLSQEDAPNA